MRTLSFLIMAAMIGGCAQTPPVQTTYYAARSAIHVRVTRTLACNTANQPLVASTVTAASSHSADPNSARTVSFAAIDSEFANTDLRIEFYPDGRLRGMNATTTGQGETILRSVIKLAETAALEQNADAPPPQYEALCQRLRAAFGEDPLSLTFEIRDDLAGTNVARPIPPDIQSERLFREYRGLMGDTCLRMGAVREPAAPVSLPRPGNYVMLRARQPALAEVGVTIGPADNCGASTIWTALVPVGQRGTDYDIPIPRAALFGRQVFVAAFDEAGAITQLQYARDAGGGGLLNVMQAGAEAVQTTNAEEIARLQGEANLIAAQQRLIRCQANPENC